MNERKPSVLVVDDEPAIRSLCSHFIAEQGWEAAEAPCADAALERLSSSNFDIVVTDLLMDGGMDGSELIRHARASHPKTSVILMTGFPSLETAVQAIRDGASDYIIKPFTSQSLIGSIKKCWESRRLAEELEHVKSLKLELAAAYEEIAQLEQVRTDFTSRVGHELRSPLSTILSATDLLSRLALPEEARRLIEMLQRGGSGMRARVDDLLNFSDLENNRLRCRKRDTDLGEMLKALIRDYRPLWDERGLKVRIEAAPREAQAWADPDILLMAFKHLLANAILHNVPAGTVDIAVSRSPEDTKVRFTSTHKGVPDEELPKLFDSFYQVGPCLTREVGGMGLGLAIVRQAVGLHGGTVSASLLPDRRIEFLVTLPRPSVFQ